MKPIMQVRCGNNVGSYGPDKFGFIIGQGEIKDLPNEKFHFQKLLSIGMFMRVPQEGRDMFDCSKCDFVGKDIKQWYAHMRYHHKNG